MIPEKDLQKLKTKRYKEETLFLCDILGKLYTRGELRAYTLTGAGHEKQAFPFDMLFAIFGKYYLKCDLFS